MPRNGPLILAAAIVLSACGSDDVMVADAWARASAPTQTSGAVYFDLTTADDDTLVGASVPGSVASAAEIHEVVIDDHSMDVPDEASGDTTMNDSMDDSMESMDETSMDEMGEPEGSHDMDMGGLTRMQESADGLALTGGETVSFEPGGYHVMLVDLVQPLEVGDEFELTLDLLAAEDVTVTVEVAEAAP